MSVRAVCSVEGCDSPVLAKGRCHRCYYRRLHREHYADPVIRARILAQRRERHQERYRDDPDYRERRRANNRATRLRRRGRPEGVARDRARDRERYRRLGGKGYARWRGTLLLEQGFACALCGELITAEVAHVDHIVPVSRGGSSDKSNLQATCPPCNMRKGSSA